MNGKQNAALEAVKYVRNGMVVGLGSGTTSHYFIAALASAIKAGELKDISGIPTSLESDRLAREGGIPLVSLRECGVVDLAVDGADQIDPKLNLIKGLGGALVREKIIEQNARRFICIADETKLIKRLGTHCPVPVEVITFCHDAHEAFFHSLGGTPHLRTAPDGSPYLTDNGNYIYDLKFSEGIDSPADLERKLRARAGVLGTGLFISLAQMAIVGSEAGVRVIHHH